MTSNAIDTESAAIPTMPMASATAGVPEISMTAVMRRAMELPMPTGTRTSGFFDAATNGSTTIASGIKMKRGDAGELSGPSHHSGLPIVRLVIAIANTLAPASTHVMNATVRQPSDKYRDGGGETCGGSNSMPSPYSDRLRRPSSSLTSHGEDPISEVVGVLPHVERAGLHRTCH